MANCKITVIKRAFEHDLVQQHCSLSLPPGCTGCPKFALGDTFIVADHTSVPNNFCAWAWADIQKDVITVMFDGKIPWIKQAGTAIACCTDGLMPVTFKIEKYTENQPC